MSPGPYHLISLGTLLLVSYFVSLIMVQTRLIPLHKHRKLWNTLLLCFFLSTSILGLLLVVKLNYKLNISWIEEAMQWHVDSGIGFALLGMFHLFWHTRYYTRRPDRSEDVDPGTSEPISYSNFQSRFLFILLGYISMMAQLVLLREFLKNFHGNELVIAIFLAVWMVFTALGARLGSDHPGSLAPRRISFLLIVLSGLPILVYILLILVSRFLFLPGVQPGVLDTMITLVLLSSPFTVLSGFLFGSLSPSVKNLKSGSSPYMLDALGSVAAGMLFAALLVHLLNNFQLLTLLLLTTSAGVILIFKIPSRSAPRWVLLLTTIVLFSLSLVPDLHREVEELRYRNEEIIETRDTPYGNLTFTRANGQVAGYMDGNPLLTSSDLMGAEESVHFSALQHPDPASFLLLGGGLSGQIFETEKYKPQKFDYCEANPWIYRLGRNHFEDNPDYPFRFIPSDGRTWLMRNKDSMYDVIISNAGDPLTIGWNRYFTLEFYRLVKQHLSPGGVFCMHLTTADNYVNEEGLLILAINDTTLREVFPHVLIVPGSSTYFLASDRPLSLDFPGLLAQAKISTTYVHPDYLDSNHLRFDSDQLTKRIEEQDPKINSDLWPRLFFASLMGNESKMGSKSMKVIGIIAAFFFLFLLLRYTPVKRIMYVTGFTGAGIQIMLIMAVQSFYGFAYMLAPIMITLFMCGIVAGIFTWKKLWHEYSKGRMMGLVLIMAAVSLCGSFIPAFGGLFESRWTGQAILGLLNFIPGMIVGSVYAMGIDSKIGSPQGKSGALYSADLTGAALGTVLPAIFLLPLLGATNTFILFFCINLITGLSLMLRSLKPRGDG